MADRSITSAWSATPNPPALWPPPRTDSSLPVERAWLTAATTSATSAQRAIIAGRLSIIALKTLRASS
jgi:hypothetical protein